MSGVAPLDSQRLVVIRSVVTKSNKNMIQSSYGEQDVPD
jgi:hypothetical protein